jgi:hypothetical protein
VPNFGKDLRKRGSFSIGLTNYNGYAIINRLQKLKQKPMSTNAESLNNEIFPGGDQVFEDVLGRDKDFWDAYAEEHREEPVLGANLGGRLASRMITGTSESGARILIRDFDTQVFHRLPQPGVYDPGPVDETTGELNQYQKGVSIKVSTTTDKGDSRTVELYVPDDPGVHPDVEPLHAVTFGETHDGAHSEKIVPADKPVPEDEGLFDKGVEEIKFYLGDRVIWDSRESREIPERRMPDSLNGGLYI